VYWLQPSFLPHYLQIASRKLLFFHGRHSINLDKQGHKQGHDAENSRSSSSTGFIVKLADLVSSSVMAELQELLLLGAVAEQERDMFSNWFTLQVWLHWGPDQHPQAWLIAAAVAPLPL